MNFAIIGCGRIAANHIDAALKNGYKVVGLCDLNQRAMDALKFQFRLDDATTYLDFKEMLTKEKVDVLAIAVDSGIRARITLAALEYAPHLVMEKPMAMSLDDADAVLEKASQKVVKVAICQQNRFNEAIQALRHAVEEGRFGRISHGSIHVRWYRDHAYYSQGAWRGTWAKDGGALMNQCIHGIDLLRWMLGNDIERLYGATRRQCHPYIEAEDVGMAVIEFKNGAIATVEGTTNTYPENLQESLCIFGERGSVKLGGTSANEVVLWRFADERPEDETIRNLKEKTLNVYGNGHIKVYQDMKQAIEENREPYINGMDGRRALETVLAIYKSQKTHAPVDFPLEHFGTTDMAGVFD